MPYAEHEDAMIDEFSRAYLRALVAYANGNQAAAAQPPPLDRRLSFAAASPSSRVNER